jgi:hypothetical protein
VNYGPAILGKLTLPLKLSEMEKSNRDESLSYLPAKRHLALILRVGTDNPLDNAALAMRQAPQNMKRMWSSRQQHEPNLAYVSVAS